MISFSLSLRLWVGPIVCTSSVIAFASIAANRPTVVSPCSSLCRRPNTCLSGRFCLITNCHIQPLIHGRLDCETGSQHTVWPAWQQNSPLARIAHSESPASRALHGDSTHWERHASKLTFAHRSPSFGSNANDSSPSNQYHRFSACSHNSPDRQNWRNA